MCFYQFSKLPCLAFSAFCKPHSKPRKGSHIQAVSSQNCAAIWKHLGLPWDASVRFEKLYSSPAASRKEKAVSLWSIRDRVKEVVAYNQMITSNWRKNYTKDTPPKPNPQKQCELPLLSVANWLIHFLSFIFHFMHNQFFS